MFSKRLISMVAAAKRYIAADVVLRWIALVANVALFYLIGLFLQQTLDASASVNQALVLAAAAVVALAVRLVCQTAAQRMGLKAAGAAKITIRQAVYDKLVKLGPAYKESIPTAKAVQISVEGVEHLESYFGSYLPQLFYALVAPLTLFACLAPLCLPAAIALLVCVPFIPASIMAVQKIAKRTMKRYWGSYTDLGAMFLESIQGLTTLKIFQADEARHEQMNTEAETFRQATMRLLRMQLNSITIMDFFAFGGAAVGIAVTLFELSQGHTTFGAAFTVVFLSAEFFLPMRTLGSFFHTAMSGMSAADTMFELLDTPEPPSGTRCVDPANASITCTDVSYSYDGQRTVLSGVNFEAPQGSFIGVTGASGSGKSTLAGVLTGANGSYTGTVEIGGVDLRELSRSSLRETITNVSFSSYLFKGTVRSNLQLAKPGATDAELWDVLSRCRLEGFVRASGGLDMAVAAEGGNLSGGQRQRLAMARALLNDTPVYVFDEATSNIDVESETAIIALVHELAKTKTVIMISHRLSALRDADAIYVFSDGCVVERGTHDVLVEAGGEYAQLWAEQAELEAFTRAVEGEGEQDAESADPATTAADPSASEAAANTEAASKEFPPGVKRRSNFSVMFRLVRLTKPLLPVMILAIVLGVAGFDAAIFLTVFATYGLLDLAGQSQGIAYMSAVVLVGVCGLLRGPLRYGEQLCNHYLAFRILALVRDKVFAAMRKLAPAKLEGRDKGDLVSLVTSDVELLEVFYAHTLSPAAIAIIVSVGMVIYMATLSPALAALALIAYLVVGVLVPWVSSKASGTRGRAIRDAIGSMNTFVLDSLRGLIETLQFGRAEARSRELAERMEALQASERPLKERTAFAISLTGLIVMVFDLLMLAAAMGLVAAGSLEFGPALLCVAALMSSFGPVIAVANLGSTLQQTLASGARVLDLLEEKPTIEDVVDGASVKTFEGATLRRVDFSYAGSPVLTDVNLRIEPGSVVRIAGRSGAGKSTLLKLLMRFWDADKGVIELSGCDIRRINTNSLRTVEGFMTQETFLFNATIRENLTIARPQATDEELRAALEKASLTSLIDRLPEGIDTPLGDLGDSLSGGERQRLGLARVFLHDAPFILLDEPTSNLDSLNEAAVLRALSENREGKTIVLVSHRPSAAAIADATYNVERPNRVS